MLGVQVCDMQACSTASAVIAADASALKLRVEVLMKNMMMKKSRTTPTTADVLSMDTAS